MYRLTHEGESSTPRVGQSDTYDDFYKPEDAFSTTENYLKFNSFIVGMKLTDTYGSNTDLCVNDIVDAIDSRTYFKNNITVHRKEMENNEHDTMFLPYLNVTGAIYGPVADSLPSCYAFIYDVAEYERSRFMTFESSWGNFFLAFLFNQMGNALNFQSKFERIQQEKERQNFAGVWLEYGDLVYLIITFQPIESASLENVENIMLQWMQDHEWMGEEGEPTEAHKAVVKTGVSTLARFVYSAGESFGAGLAAVKGAIYANMEAKRLRREEKQRAAEELRQQQQILLADADGTGPRVQATYTQ